MPEFSKESLVSLVREWQGKLRLNDWHLDVEIWPKHSMAGKDAEIEYSYETHEATLYLANKPFTFEELVDTVVHELLHLQFWWTKVSGPGVEPLLVEYAIRNTAAAFVSLNGGNQIHKRTRRSRAAR